MWVVGFVCVEWICIAIFSAYMIWYYARKNVEWFTKLFVFIAWFFGFSIIVLLPYDVYISYILDGDTKEYSIDAMHFVWRLNYWIAFLMCYFVFPMLGEYVISGSFTVKAKLWTALIANLIFYAILGVLGAIALIYLWAKGQFDGDKGSFAGFLIFCTNAYGLILIIIFLSYGLVGVPRKYYGMKSFEFRKSYVYFKVQRKEETFHDKRFKLEECASTIIALKQKISEPQNKIYAQTIMDKCPKEFLDRAKSFASLDYIDESYKNDLKSLEKLNYEMKRCVENYERAYCSLNESLKEAIWLEDLDNSRAENFDSRVGSKMMQYSWWRKFIYNWETKFYPIFSFIIFIIATFFSTVIVFGEVSIFLFRSDTSIIKDMFVNNFDNFIVTTIVIMIPLGYLCLCTFYGIFHVKIYGLYALHPNHHTDSFSLNFSATILTRLAPPLCYNFILLAKLNGTVFEEFMGEMEFIPILGVNFQKLFPIILVLLVAFNLFDVWGKLLRFIGFDAYTFVSKYDQDKSKEGQTYVKAERPRIERQTAAETRDIRWLDDSNNRFSDNIIEFRESHSG